MGGDALEGHDVEDLFAEAGFALTGAVLHDLHAARADHLGHGFGDVAQGEVGDVGHAAGQRDDLGAVGDGEQGADGGDAHAVGALGIVVDEPVQPGVVAQGLLGHCPSSSLKRSSVAEMVARLWSVTDTSSRPTSWTTSPQATSPVSSDKPQ